MSSAITATGSARMNAALVDPDGSKLPKGAGGSDDPAFGGGGWGTG